MQDRYPDESDPVKRLLYAAMDAYAPAVGALDPACRAIYLADLARLVAAAQAANDALLHPERAASDVPGAAAGDVERALRRMREG